MGEMNMQEMSLPALFEQSRKIHLAASESSVDQDTLRKGCEMLRQCEEMSSKLGLFSTNETKDDISTANLKYILVPFYLGELIEKVSQDDRIQVLKISQAKLKEFIAFCEVMELVPKEELQMSGANSSQDLRARKIARFKRQRAAEAKLLEIMERKERRGRSTRAAATSSHIKFGEEDELDDDGEEEREAWLTSISLALCKAFDLLDMVKKEEEMLSAINEKKLQYIRKWNISSNMVKKEEEMLSAINEKKLQEGEKEFSELILDERAQKAEAWHRESAARARYAKPSPPITCATFAQDVLEGRRPVSEAHDHKHQPMIFGPASLVGKNSTSDRERVAAQVFQPHFRLPTMSIEEAGLKEMEMMNTWQENNRKLMEEANSAWYKDDTKKIGPPAEDEEDDDDDAAQDKARAWDDWKDDNPRGAGNKKLTPCG